MDSQIVNKGLNFTKKKKKWFLLLAAFGVTSYGFYRVYNLPSVVRRRKRVLRLLSALLTIVEVVSESAETFGVVSHDLRVFLQSDSDEIPNSLKQVSKLANSREFSDSVVCITAALTKGVFRGYLEESSGGNSVENGSKSWFYDRFMDRLCADSSSGFVSVVAGSFARNLVLAFYQSEDSEKGGKKSGEGPSLVDVMCSERGKGLIGECIEKFVSTAVAVYLERTMSVNTYDELFAGLTNPKHDKQVRDVLVALCNGSIETLVKTSHQVLTSSKSGEPVKLAPESCDLSQFVVTRSNSDVSRTFHPEMNDAHNLITVKQNKGGGFFDSNADRTSSSGESWVSSVSSTLAVPSNRKLVLDVTARVTFETVRSFLDFLLEKLFTSLKRSFAAVNQAVFNAGHEVVRYVSAKSYLITSICLSLCLHVFGGTWALMAA